MICVIILRGHHFLYHKVSFPVTVLVAKLWSNIIYPIILMQCCIIVHQVDYMLIMQPCRLWKIVLELAWQVNINKAQLPNIKNTKTSESQNVSMGKNFYPLQIVFNNEHYILLHFPHWRLMKLLDNNGIHKIMPLLKLETQTAKCIFYLVSRDFSLTLADPIVQNNWTFKIWSRRMMDPKEYRFL